MMKYFASILFLAALGCAAKTTAPETKSSPNGIAARLEGKWTGTLEYKDYQDENRRVTLPTVLEVSNLPEGALSMRYTYDDGPGKTVISTDLFALDTGAKQLRWGGEKDPPEQRALYTVQKLECGESDDACTLIAETEGKDDDRPATIRETIVIGGDRLSILKEVRFDPAGQFEFRHSYALARGE